MSQPLSPDQEALARELADVLHKGCDDLLLHIARQLIATTDATLFGDTEFRLRDLAHQIAARAYELHLREKKTATTAPRPPAPPADKPPISTAGGSARRSASLAPSPSAGPTTTAGPAATACARSTRSPA